MNRPVARFVGGPAAREWRTLRSRAQRLREEIGATDAVDTAIRRHTAEILGWESARSDQVIRAIGWLSGHPVHGSHPRQIPIRGVDTKWFKSHRSVLTDLLSAATGSFDLGIADAVGSLPWVRHTRVVCWGDLDSHGFAIRHRLRTHLPTVASVLMDEQTLLDHRDPWVLEPKPTRARLPSLTASEHATWERLRVEGDVRLEQERIPWERSLDQLSAAVESG